MFFCLLLAAAGQPAARPATVDPVPEVRRRAESDLRQQTLDDWDARTRGESRNVADGEAADISLAGDRINLVRIAAEAAADSNDRQALLYLEFQLASEAIRRGSAGASAEDRPAIEDSLVKVLGYRDYVTFSQQLRGFHLPDLLAESFRFIRETNLMYQTLLAAEAREVLGKEVAALTPADLSRLLDEEDLAAFFPLDLLVPAFREFLGGAGLSLATAGGDTIRIDASSRPEKNGRAACLPVEIPDDIRISIRPSGGPVDFETLFHEGGHAVHFANAPAAPWELSRLGPAALSEGIGALFAGVWEERAWLTRYGEFVRRSGGTTPVLSELDAARAARRRLLRDLYLFRRFAGALLFETILHGADPELYRPYFFEAEGAAPKELYRQIFSFASGVSLTKEDAENWSSDVDAFLYAADYVRGFALAAILDEQLNSRFGAPWFQKPEAGAWLKTTLFATGNRLSPEEVAAAAGASGFSFDPLKKRLTRLYGETEAAIEAARR